MEWSEFNDSADRHTSVSGWWSSAGVRSGEAGSWMSAPAGASRRSPPRVRPARRASSWPPDIPAEMLASGVNVPRRPAWATSSSCSRTPPASIFRRRASTPPSGRAGESSSSLTRRAPRGASEAFSPGRADGDQLVGRARSGPLPLDSDEDDDGAAGCAHASGRNARAPLPAHPAAIGGLLEGEVGSRRSPGAGRGHLRVRLPEHFTAYISAISAPIRAMIEQHGRGPGRGLDAITVAAADAGGGSAAELLERGATRLGNRLAPTSSAGRPRRRSCVPRRRTTSVLPVASSSRRRTSFYAERRSVDAMTCCAPRPALVMQSGRRRRWICSSGAPLAGNFGSLAQPTRRA